MDRKLVEKVLEDRVEAWHDGDGEGLSLHEYLGWTWMEYKAWVENGSVPERVYQQ